MLSNHFNAVIMWTTQPLQKVLFSFWFFNSSFLDLSFVISRADESWRKLTSFTSMDTFYIWSMQMITNSNGWEKLVDTNSDIDQEGKQACRMSPSMGTVHGNFFSTSLICTEEIIVTHISTTQINFVMPFWFCYLDILHLGSYIFFYANVIR